MTIEIFGVPPPAGLVHIGGKLRQVHGVEVGGRVSGGQVPFGLGLCGDRERDRSGHQAQVQGAAFHEGLLERVLEPSKTRTSNVRHNGASASCHCRREAGCGRWVIPLRDCPVRDSRVICPDHERTSDNTPLAILD